MLNTIKTFAVVGMLAAGWLGLGAWVLSDMSTAKQSIDTVARQQAASPIELVGYAKK